MRAWAAGLLLALALTAGATELRFATCFDDHMVVQRDCALPVFGHAAPGAVVVIDFAGHRAQAVAAASGSWRVVLPPSPAGGPHQLSASSAGGSAEIVDVLVGDRWLCAGQSNIGVNLGRATGGAELAAAADDAGLRLCRIRSRAAADPVIELGAEQARWQRSDPEAASAFSAVGYAFGHHVRAAGVAVPIGLIQCHKPGSFIETWIPAEALAAAPEATPILGRWEELVRDHAALQLRYQHRHAEWKSAHGERFEIWKRERSGGPFQPHQPWPPPQIDSGLGPARFFNGNLAALTPLPIAGVLWYQGESNSDRAFQYRHLLRLLVRSWRNTWNQPDLPVIVVQVPEFETDSNPYDHQDGGDWTVLRESQAQVLREERTALVVSLGLGDPRDIHPPRKVELGSRCASAALRLVYDHELPAHPRLVAAEALGHELLLRFSDVGAGLRTLDDGPPIGFVVAGSDRIFHPASARLLGPDQVAISSPLVPDPVAGRYAWDDVPAWNLVGAGALPAAPGRSDSWPLPTQDVVAPLDWHRLEETAP